MRALLLATDGKVFTASTLDHLIDHTRLREFVGQAEGSPETPADA